jgi:AcrR family transcriptional regulator
MWPASLGVDRSERRRPAPRAGVLMPDTHGPLSGSTRSGRTQGERRESSEGAFLDSAAVLVAEGGAGRATLERIARRAHLSKALTTHHFGSKDVLIRRLVERSQARLRQALGAQVAEERSQTGDLTALELVRGSVSAYLALFERPTADNRALLALWAAMIPEGVAIDGVIDADRRGIEAWAQRIREGHEDGSIRPDVDPNAGGYMLFGLTRGLAALLMIDEDVDVALVQAGCDDWITGVLAPRVAGDVQRVAPMVKP